MDEETWVGPKLASEAEEDLDFDKLGGEADDEDEDDDPDSEEFEVQLSPSDERLLEELLRMKLTSLPATATGNNPVPGSNPGDLSSNSAVAASAASLLPLSKNRGLFQPRSKLEQFEDIIFESQLLEAAL